MSQLVIIASDVEIGHGGPSEDFPQSAWMGEWLAERPRADRTDLVFNGDTFDFLKTPVDGAWPRHIDEPVAMRKWAAIEAAHGGFFDALADWLLDPTHHLWFIVGNHDLEIQFAAVQRALRSRLRNAERVHFPGNELQWGELHIQHGHLHDPMFRVEGPPFLRFGDRDILNLPWGAVALLDVVMPHIPELGALDRLKPRERVLELLPDFKTLAQNAFWTYFTRDFWRDLMEGDPVKHVSAAMLREVVYRMGTADSELALDSHLLAALTEPGSARVAVVGHWHRPAWQTQGERRLLMLGAFRNEFELEPDGVIGRPIGKVHAEVWMDEARVVRCNLIENEAPPPPSDHMPDHIDALRPVVLRHMS